MLLNILSKINNLNELIFSPLDNFVEKLPIADWAIDAICDSVHLIPILFVVFLIVEIVEFYYADKINKLLKNAGNKSVLLGALVAIFPQCGFSVIASTLYIKKIIPVGTLIAVYLATSDETIPILLATPSKAHLIVPIVGIKVFIGILMGYYINFADKYLKKYPSGNSPTTPIKIYASDDSLLPAGCCQHDIEHAAKREILIHPILHTINIFGFILIITLILNYCLTNVSITNFISGGKILQPIIAAFVGLIPNCAISIGLTMMLIKGTITFGALMSGLLANAGLGLLVLLNKNDLKDTIKIITMLLIISIISGITINVLT